MNAPVTIHPITIRTANLNEADEARRVDAFVRATDGATPFHLSGWNRAVAASCDQVSHPLIAESAGDIIGLLPLTEVHSPLFGRALVSSGFAVGGGVLVPFPREGGGPVPKQIESFCGSGPPPSRGNEIAQMLVDAAETLAVRLSCPTLELRGGIMPEGDGWHHDETTYLGFSRDLAKDDEAELLAIPRKQRAEVRRALAFDLQVETGTGSADRAAHYSVYAESVRNLGTPVFPRALFESVLDELGDAADILTVRHEGRAIASVLSLYWGGTVMPYWGGGTRDARSWRANDLMYYALMLHARKEKGCSRFDFGRSKAGTGPAAFKHNWGFEAVPLAYAKKSLDGSPVRDINPMSPKYRLQVALWQKLPLGLANRIGPMIARGLG
jgi:FemAB-related protein (PEP-CTERM system-associated)